jgi:hypothetical protein
MISIMARLFCVLLLIGVGVVGAQELSISEDEYNRIDEAPEGFS